MSTQHERLRRARIEAGYKRATDAIKKFNFPGPAYKGNENGNAVYGYEAAKRYGKAFGVVPAWLYDDDYRGPMRPGGDPAEDGIPILGTVSAGGESYTLWDYEPGVVNERLPIVMAGAEMALPIKGDSMFPRFKEGEYAIAGSISLSPKDWIGRDVVAQVADGRVVLKQLWRCPTGRWTLTSINPLNRPIEDVDIDWVRPVISNLILPS